MHWYDYRCVYTRTPLPALYHHGVAKAQSTLVTCRTNMSRVSRMLQFASCSDISVVVFSVSVPVSVVYVRNAMFASQTQSTVKLTVHFQKRFVG